MSVMKRWPVVLGLGVVPLLGGCVSAANPYDTMAYSGYYGSGYSDTQVADVRIGIQIGGYPDLVPIPGYPVYYAPGVSANYFFYDGLYWVFWNDNWYAASWYNGPWVYVAPVSVPLFILRVPVRYYRSPPLFFRDWRPDAPPHWGAHWGPQWERHREGWDRWNPAAAPRPAPLPLYQRQYSGPRYPRFEQQQELRRERYGYQPHDPVGRQLYQNPNRPRPEERPQPRSVIPAPQRAPLEGDQPGYPNQYRVLQPSDRPEQRGFVPAPPRMPQDRGDQYRREQAPRPVVPQRDDPGSMRVYPGALPNPSQRQEDRRGERPPGQQTRPPYPQPGQGTADRPQRESGQRGTPRDKDRESQRGQSDQRPDRDERGPRNQNP